VIELNPHELGAHAHYATTLFLSEVGARTAAYDKIVRRVSKTALGRTETVRVELSAVDPEVPVTILLKRPLKSGIAVVCGARLTGLH